MPITESALKIFKICIIGDQSTGKSNIRRILIGRRFKRDTAPTIGSDFSFIEKTSNNENIKALIWDLSGNKKYKSARQLYLQGIQGCILVFDLTSRSSFYELEEWISDLENGTVSKGVPMIIFGNKSDLIPIIEQEIDDFEIQQYVNKLKVRFQNNFDINYFTTSASNGTNIDEGFSLLLSSIQKWLDNRKNK